MTALEALLKILGVAGAQVQNLDAVLAALVTRFPDLKADLDPIIAALSQAVTPAALASLGPTVLSEALAIALGKVNPTPHAGDAI